MKPSATLLAIVIELGLSLHLFGQPKTPGLEIAHLTGDYYVYTTSRMFGGESIPSNSMYVITDRGAVMFDTPWDTTQIQPLLDSIQIRHHTNVVLCIATHFHDDRTAGFDFLRQKGVMTYSSKQTLELCKVHGKRRAEYSFTNDTTFTVGNHRFLACYPGEGHSKDNIVIWCDDAKILYGGCLVKSTDTNDLGNLEDANLAEWPRTIANVINRFPAPKYVIPGHYGWADGGGLAHTLKLLQENKNNR